MGAGDFFQPKDLFWTAIGVVLGGLVGGFTSLYFYRRGRRDTREDVERAEGDKARSARRLVERVGERLSEAAATGSAADVHAARRELEAGRRDLITTGQDALVEAADDAIDTFLQWVSEGAPTYQLSAMVVEAAELMKATRSAQP